MMHAHVAHLFHDVWSQEKRSFQYWYDLERKGFQGHLGQAVVKARRERTEAMLAFRPGVEPSLEVLAACGESQVLKGHDFSRAANT